MKYRARNAHGHTPWLSSRDAVRRWLDKHAGQAWLRHTILIEEQSDYNRRKAAAEREQREYVSRACPHCGGTGRR